MPSVRRLCCLASKENRLLRLKSFEQIHQRRLNICYEETEPGHSWIVLDHHVLKQILIWRQLELLTLSVPSGSMIWLHDKL